MSAPKKIFGTDGVRGTANTEPVTAETALKLGRAAGHVFKNLESQPRGRGRHKIVLGKDTRLSGYMLENALSSGILSMGVDVLFIGPLPTPGVAYVTRSLRADAGIVITASHNPYGDNGIKFFRADGYKLDDKVEYQIESLVFSGEIETIRPTADAIGKAVRIDDALGRYIEYAKASFPRGMTLEGMRIVVDCAHGAAYKSTPCVLRELGAEVIVYGNKPDGKNINQECGSMYPSLLCQKIREHRADLGLAHDGDADRILLCDEKGALIDGDDIMAIAGLDLLAQGLLASKTLVATVMSNAGLEAAIAAAGGRVVRTAVGDRQVIDEMLRHGYNLGGEQSGHMIFRDYSTTGDGLVAALQILRIMRTKELPLSRLARCWTRFPQIVTNIVVREKPPFAELKRVSRLVAEAETELKAQGGRVFLRYSGTEPKARLLLEGRNPAALRKWARKIADEIRKQAGG
ncbi:MAG TPA: phosphoglucosamine mutase [Candidatus Paceibacterota bacterium]|nr:phosphoglucosamine mutase [Verrucomicrobiota bacterium]HSA12341.1 phosphoglucosamine mutase [Candidatus Paceibacterota bacterium]